MNQALWQAITSRVLIPVDLTGRVESLGGHWHLLPIGASLAFTLHYLHGGVRLLRRRQAWILERATQERGEA